MSCTSPLTVARTIFPFAALSAFSICGSKRVTAAFIASADCSTSATMSRLSLKSRPTSSMPAMRGPLMISIGGRPASARSMSSARPSFVPSITQRARRSSKGSAARASAVGAGLRSRKCAANAAMGSSPRQNRRSSASCRSSSGMLG